MCIRDSIKSALLYMKSIEKNPTFTLHTPGGCYTAWVFGAFVVQERAYPYAVSYTHLRAENPKRARRMARRSLAVQGVGTKAQQALALARGAGFVAAGIQ